jgi:hypothetical protein
MKRDGLVQNTDKTTAQSVPRIIRQIYLAKQHIVCLTERLRAALEPEHLVLYVDMVEKGNTTAYTI